MKNEFIYHISTVNITNRYEFIYIHTITYPVVFALGPWLHSRTPHGKDILRDKQQRDDVYLSCFVVTRCRRKPRTKRIIDGKLISRGIDTMYIYI